MAKGGTVPTPRKKKKALALEMLPQNASQEEINLYLEKLSEIYSEVEA